THSRKKASSSLPASQLNWRDGGLISHSWWSKAAARRTGWRAQGFDVRQLGNVSVMANTDDPRAFYRVSKIVLMPSLWGESFGRVAAEAMINGIPVLGTARGALPETFEQAGFLFDVPERYTEYATLLPTADEVAPWID